MKTPESLFLHERNPNLHTSQDVEGVVDYLRAGGEPIPNEPRDKISAYLGFLANRDYVNDGILTGDPNSIDRQIEAHIIKAGNVPEAYFELQRRIAREQGHGDIIITREMREQMIESVQSDQRAGLAKWVEYLGGEDGGYTNWFKYYTFDSITKLGNYDKEKSEFLKRSKGTTAAYPDLNREALAYVFDGLNKSRVHSEKVDGGADDEQLQKLLKAANFGKLYAHAVLKVTPSSPELLKKIKGSWTKFDQTSDPRTARRLAESLQGHGTGWCTAGESTAITQLKGGDFYVYYTRDEVGKDTVPRVAIRMEQDEVAEVRGVNASQELEPGMLDIAAKQLKGLPGGEQYIQKAEDMRRLTAIEHKVSENPSVKLSSSELVLLYEFDHDVYGFGYGAAGEKFARDPRIAEIRAKRGAQDKPELPGVIAEAIKGQLKYALAAHNTVANNLKAPIQRLFRKEVHMAPADFERLFEIKDKAWRENGVYDHLVEQFINRGVRYNLLATPNVEASEDKIVALAEAFSEDTSRGIHNANSALYGSGLYTARELSGNFGSNTSVRFSLIPSKHNAELNDKTTDEQLQILKEFQARQPRLQFHVPSLLDAVTYWYRLRAAGDNLMFNGNFYKTHIRHFDLDPKEHFVLDSYVMDDCRQYLSGSYIREKDDARIALG